MILAAMLLLVIMACSSGGGSSTSPTATQKAGNQIAPVENNATPNSNMGDLCTILNTSRNNLAALNQQMANEKNPLRQNSLQQQIGQINQQENASLENFWKVNHHQFTNFTGVVSGFNTMQYSSGPGVMLEITLPCEFKINFHFIEITNPVFGNFDPENQTPLSKWRTALENIVVGDRVTFSGRLGSSFAVMTELKKQGGITYKVPDAYMPMDGKFAMPTVSQGGLTWMPITFSNSWPKANAYCAELNINGQTGWRMPTQSELVSLFNSGAMNGQGWTLGETWTSTPWPSNGNGWYSIVSLQNGTVHSQFQTEFTDTWVSCVRASSSAQ
jgi:hypothetical protein